MAKRWHAKPEGAETPTDADGHPKLVLVALNRSERVELASRGGPEPFDPLARERAAWILRSAEGYEHPVDRRLLDVVLAIAVHFHAPEVRFLSGYRAPRRPGSYHGYGRAIDLVIPGATDEDVASWARGQGFAGVGIYPVSGFVHVDVRERSFFWVDPSGPGQPNRTTGILAGDAAASDARAREQGKRPSPAPGIGRDVEAAVVARAKAISGASPAAASLDDEPDDDDERPATKAP